MRANEFSRSVTPTFKIEEGYHVHDAANKHIGSVRSFRFSDENPRTPEAETETTAGVDERPHDLISHVVEVFAGDTDMPEELRERLLRQGFVRIDQGLFQSDLFVTMDDVSHVSDNVVHLKVHKDKLISI